YSPDVVVWDAAAQLLHYAIDSETDAHVAAVSVANSQPHVVKSGPLDVTARAQLTGLPVLSGGWK
ncbi:hypothetical protein, partial [Serratia sp. 506_PEND]|uniref:hypothetical protein n=1 Tax=Serratia sp. 506_PEND TaxID=1572666 RepID=UPI0006608DDB